MKDSIFGIDVSKATRKIYGSASDFVALRQPLLGRNGHVAIPTDLDAAAAELKRKGIVFDVETAAYPDDGQLKNIYLVGEYGGFAIHILRQ